MRMSLFLFGLLTFSFSSFSDTIQFPKNFRWCVATAAHQVEGGNKDSDWWVWEKENGHIKNGEPSNLACDHWNKVDEDVALMKGIHVTDYRMSVEWAKIEPKQGVYDKEAIAHYKHEIQALKAAGIRPIITLHHFTFPQWVAKLGGWEWPDLPKSFADYTTIVYTEIAPDVKDWVTVNEPGVSILNGYVLGIFPPTLKRAYSGMIPPMIGMLKAHAASYHRLHDLAQKSGHEVRVGIAHHLRPMDPANWWNPLDHIAATVGDKIWNWAIPDALETGRFVFKVPFAVRTDEVIEGLKGTQDYMGVNYYSGDQLHIGFSGISQVPREELKKNELGWDIYPEGFYRILKQVHERYPKQSILITENGVADREDKMRSQFLVDHLSQIARAIKDGVPVEGYCHWTLMDNYEWIEGTTARFGLFEMDYKTMKRLPRASAKLFSSIAEKNELAEPLTKETR